MASSDNPTTPASTSTDHRYPPALDDWRRLTDNRTGSRVRGPAIAAAQRLGLASSRAAHLEEQLHATRDRLINLRPGTPSDVVFRLEDRCVELERELHNERVSLWRDLHPLLTEARDAATERLRLAWLTELLRLLDGGARK